MKKQSVTPWEGMSKLRYVKGSSPVEGKVVVIDVWASWCGPCMKSIPHLIELQAKYSKELQIVGLTDEPHAKVASMAGMLGQINYAMAGDAALITKPLMEDNGQEGIPCCFVFSKTGSLVLVAHPMDPKFDATVAEEVAKAGVFGGAAHSLGGDASKKVSSTSSYPVPAAVDETLPTVKIQVRTPGGPRAFTLNSTHTVAHLKGMVAKETGKSTTFDLQQAYPKKTLTDNEALAGYSGAALNMI